MYKQKFKPRDERESVIVNKLSVEYRKLKAIAEGVEIFKGKVSKEVIEQQGVVKKRDKNQKIGSGQGLRPQQKLAH